MNFRSPTRSACLALLVAFPALAAAPVAKPKAAKAPVYRPKPGTIATRTLPGGWLTQVAGTAEHVQILVPGFSGASQRVLLLTEATSDDYAELLASNVTILDAAGKTLRTESLPANRPYDGDLSPDGTFAAVLAHPFAATGEQAFVFGMDDTGKKWRKPADPEARVVTGNGWVALTRPPLPLAAAHDPDDAPEAVRPAAAPAVFLARDGLPMKPPQPITGALARSATAVASVADKKLTVYDAKLAKRASADIPYVVAYPGIAANASLIAVADFGLGEANGDSGVLLFDGAAKPLGKFAMRAAVGVATSIAPDGAAVLASPAWLPEGPVMATPGADDELAVALFDRTGKERWRHTEVRRSKDEAFSGLSVANAGAWAAAALVSGDDKPAKLFVFDAKGKVVYEAEGNVSGIWLDPTGQWLYTVEPAAVSRLKVSALRAGTAFPDEEDGGAGVDIEAEINAQDAREFPSGTPTSFPPSP